MKNLLEFVDNPEDIGQKDKIRQIMINERYDMFMLMESGRVFKKRAKGLGGSYDVWHEVDLLREVREDLNIN